MMENIFKNKDEAWRALQGYEGKYIISSHGRLFSLFHNMGYGIIKNEINEIKASLDNSRGNHHYVFHLRNLNDHVSVRCASLIAKHFLPKPHGKKKFHKVQFIDGNCFNFHADNLAYYCNFKNKESYIKHLKNAALDKRKYAMTTNRIIDYLEGDKNAIQQIILNNEKKLYWSIYDVTKSHTYIDDILQESLIKICRAIDNWMFTSPESPIGWFVVIAKNTARNYMTKERKSRTANPTFDKDTGLTLIDTL